MCRCSSIVVKQPLFKGVNIVSVAAMGRVSGRGGERVSFGQ